MSRIWIRADGGAGIGAGHLMRCLSIARAAEDLGAKPGFIVSGAESASLIAPLGVEVVQVGGDPFAFRSEDAAKVLELANPGDMVLVDSYAATDGFLSILQRLCSGVGVPVGYIDDEFRFSTGYTSSPVRLPVDVLIGYAFGADAAEYGEVYRGTGTRLLVGPKYAPIREEFRNHGYEPSPHVETVLLTTGSTNPDGTLERFVSCCLAAVPGALVDVVIGKNARFEWEGAGSDLVRVHRDPRDMASLMLASDLVVSAAGTTLYELAALGVPAVAVPIVENQVENVRGWMKMRLGGAVEYDKWDDGELAAQIGKLAGDTEARRAYSRRMRSAVDGLGAQRIVDALLGVGGAARNGI